MHTQRPISVEEARLVGSKLGVDWTKIVLEQFRHGLEAELEHSRYDPEIDTTDDNLILTAKIVWAHLKEIDDYYAWLDWIKAKAQTLDNGRGKLSGN